MKQEMQMQQDRKMHTPTPWMLLGRTAIRSATGEAIGVLDLTNPCAESNATVMVHAVNNHDALISIAKDALAFRELMNGKCGHDDYMTKLCTQCEIRAALSAAQEQS